MRDIPIKITMRHVKGYQDNSTLTALNTDAWMNTDGHSGKTQNPSEARVM